MHSQKKRRVNPLGADADIWKELCQHHGNRCPDDLCHQVISSDGIDSVAEAVDP